MVTRDELPKSHMVEVVVSSFRIGGEMQKLKEAKMKIIILF